jgi:predicted 3-demethylubiquinone-9 3-methyltransferase (glyoxalase superfamily)
MLRFPNPGSNFESFINVFKNINDKLSNYIFNLDDMVSVTIEKNLTSSSGYTGSQAIHHSTRKDRSRDPLYNQLKMYSELYRQLGWLRSTEGAALKFLITPFGNEIAKAKNIIELFIKSILCISVPNEGITTKSNIYLRPFYTIFKIMPYIENKISRDEMILSILSCKDDCGKNNINLIIDNIKNIRKSNNINFSLKKLSESSKIKINTLRNYTRVPIMFLRDTDLFEIKSNFLVLTQKGNDIVNFVNDTHDFRLRDIKSISGIKFNEFYKAIYEFFFSNKKNTLFNNKYLLQLKIPKEKVILFNPFQQLNITELSNIFEWNINKSNYKRDLISKDIVNNYEKEINTKLIFNSLNERINKKFIKIIPTKEIFSAKNKDDIIHISNNFCESLIKYKKVDFYALIESLFNELGFNCFNSRYGTNAERWDSKILYNNKIIPLEIKSPAEEIFLNIKGIRQALENKIILHSRYQKSSDINYSTLLVGFKYPNSRSDMTRLIQDIKKTFNIKIGVIDFFTLVFSFFWSIKNSQQIEKEQILKLEGFLEK